MFEYLPLVVLEAAFWCFLFFAVISIGTADAQQVVQQKNIKSRPRCIHQNFNSTSQSVKKVMKLGNMKPSRIPILIKPKSPIQIAGPNIFATTSTSWEKEAFAEAIIIRNKPLLFVEQVEKLKYSDDLRKIAHYNQILKDFTLI